MAAGEWRQALLGRLAALGFVSGEVAATRSLAILLEEPVLRQAFVR